MNIVKKYALIALLITAQAVKTNPTLPALKLMLKYPRTTLLLVPTAAAVYGCTDAIATEFKNTKEELQAQKKMTEPDKFHLVLKAIGRIANKLETNFLECIDEIIQKRLASKDINKKNSQLTK